MKLTEILKCAKAGISTDEIKAIQELDDVSVDDAIELVKAGYIAEDLKDLIKDEEKETPPETPPKEKDPETPPKEKTPPANEELDKLKAELEKKTKDLEQAQLSNTKKDIGTGEKPDPEKELAKLFAEL